MPLIREARLYFFKKKRGVKAVPRQYVSNADDAHRSRETWLLVKAGLARSTHEAHRLLESSGMDAVEYVQTHRPRRRSGPIRRFKLWVGRMQGVTSVDPYRVRSQTKVNITTYWQDDP